MKPMLKRAKSPCLVCLAITILICATVVTVRNYGYLQIIELAGGELAAYDRFLKFSVHGSKPDENVIIISMTEADIHRYGKWPITDQTMAELIEGLSQYNPGVIAVDIYRDIPITPGSDNLTNVLRTLNNVVMVKKIGIDSENEVSGPYMIDDPDRVGFTDFPVDPDGVIRRGLLFADNGTTMSTSFSMLIAQMFLKSKDIMPQPGTPNPAHMRLGNTTFIPLRANDGGYVGGDMAGYQFLLNFRGGQFNRYSLYDILEKRIPPNALSGRAVIIGVEAVSVKDYFSTPVKSIPATSGVELHALAASQIIRAALGGEKPMSFIDERYKWTWIFIWGIVGGALGLRIRSFARFLALSAGAAVMLVSSAYAAFSSGLWIPVVPPALSLLFSASLVTAYKSYTEGADRAQIMQLFSRHVSKDVAEAIWNDRDSFLFNGRPRPLKLTATVLFTDLKGFTSVSETLQPQPLMDWLNEYMEAMASIIIRHGGVINKYIGDAVMAVFGVPIARQTQEDISKDAINAVTCAIEMGSKLSRLKAEWAARGMPVIDMRVGIYTGELVAGSLGSAERLEYTVIGDTVNIASRLESFDKHYCDPEFADPACRILIGATTFTYLSGRFRAKEAGTVALKGKEEKITIYLIGGFTQPQHG
ncbi:MAG: adenylate/guanylate cyclase domain-containing protein [Nitrospirae bacterium]|nr:adenylate/guanylate cyclase domain-containing protein [Nitrospirota bacterium]